MEMEPTDELAKGNTLDASVPSVTEDIKKKEMEQVRGSALSQ
jgi:hypothetical protein